MKTFKLITAGILASAVVATASATTEIRITGSTAFRKGTVDAIERILKPGFVWGSTGGSGFGANQQIFVGIVKATDPSDPNDDVIIKCSWSGSAGGIQSLAQNIAAGQAFIAEPTGVTFGTPCTATVGTTVLTQGVADNGTDGANIGSANINESSTADAALSDAFIESTPYGTAGVIPPGFTTANLALTSTPVGIVPFVWVAAQYTLNGGATVASPYPGVTNMSLVNAQELLGGGVQLSQLTGSTNAADANTTVVEVGRDHDSGTRITQEYDIQYNQDVIFTADTGYSEVITQFIPNGATVGATQFAAQSPGTGTVTSVTPWPAETVLGENRGSGQEGFFSGSNCAAVLNRPWAINNTGASVYDITNLGMSDAASVNPGATYTYTEVNTHIVDNIKPSQNALTFNGSFPGTAAHPFGPPFQNVEQGAYSFWGVEHFVVPSGLTGTKLSLTTSIATQLTTQADFGGVGDLLSNMAVGITGDGQAIIPGLPETE
jgi:hypothetical protein